MAEIRRIAEENRLAVERVREELRKLKERIEHAPTGEPPEEGENRG